MSRRHALVIGIDRYPKFGPETELCGAVRDAQVMAEVLVDRHRFAEGDVILLCDSAATRRGLLEALEALRKRVGSSDQVVLFFSGKGSQMTDREGDEGDGLDETLVTYDSGREETENRDLSDDEINHWAARVLEKTPFLTLIFDCCHSATLHRPGWRIRSVPPDLRSVEELPPSPILVERDVEAGPRPTLLAACRDDELAYELPVQVTGEDRGAFSFHLIEALRNATPEATWRVVFERAVEGLRSDCKEQHPQLSGDGLDSPLFGGTGSASRGLDSGHELLALTDHPDPFGCRMELFRSRGGAWLPAADASFIVGDRLRIEVRHHHARHLFIYLFDVGLSGRVALLFPDHEGQEVLDPHRDLTVGTRQGRSLGILHPR